MARWRCPPESVSTKRSARPIRSNSRRASSMRWRSSSVSRPRLWGNRPKPTSSPTRSRLETSVSWRRIATVRASSSERVSATDLPAIAILPVSSGSSRAISDKRVDFPAPLGPTRAVTPPAGIESDMSRRTGVPCLAKETFSISIIGASAQTARPEKQARPRTPR